MSEMYDFRMLQLRFMQWIAERELERVGYADAKGTAILGDIEEAIAMEVAEREIDQAMAVGDLETVEQHITAITSARNAEVPVQVGRPPRDDDGNPEDNGDDVDEVECVKCGTTMQLIVDPKVSIFPVCPYCRGDHVEGAAGDEDEERQP